MEKKLIFKTKPGVQLAAYRSLMSFFNEIFLKLLNTKKNGTGVSDSLQYIFDAKLTPHFLAKPLPKCTNTK